jgi:hypothetical protein
MHASTRPRLVIVLAMREVICKPCGKFCKPFQFYKVNPFFPAGGLLHLFQRLAAKLIFQAIISGFSHDKHTCALKCVNVRLSCVYRVFELEDFQQLPFSCSR